MKILVTGGAGFLGSNFIHRTLKKRPHVEITVLDALTYSGRLSNLSEVLTKINFIQGNILDKDTVRNLVSSVDLVVHFAAESHNDRSLLKPEKFMQTNILGTLNIIQACVEFSVRLHHISTDEVFGDLPLGTNEKFSRSSPYNPSSPYSVSKASSDMLVRSWIRSFGLQATISNSSNNYGVRQHEEKLIPRSIILASKGMRPKIYGDGLNVRDWIHVDDHTDGVWAVIDKGVIGQTFLLGGDCQKSNLQIVRIILKILGLPEDFIEYVRDRPGHDLRYAIDFSDTSAELGWAPTFKSFENGIVPLIEYYTKIERTVGSDL